MDTTGEEEGGTNQESSADIYTTMCKVDSWQEAAVLHRQLSLLLSGDLEGWNKGVGGRLKKERIYVYLWLIHVVVQEKLTKYCKAIPTFLNEQNT